MLEWLLFALGVVWIVLSVVGATGLSKIPKAHEVFRWWFFLFGLYHFIFALTFLTSPTGFYSLANETTAITYQNFTEFASNLSSSSLVAHPVSETVTYAYNNRGVEAIGGLLFWYLLTVAFYFIMLMAKFLQKSVHLMMGRKDDGEEE